MVCQSINKSMVGIVKALDKCRARKGGARWKRKSTASRAESQ